MDDATISVLSAAVKRDEPPVGDKALAYTRGGPSLKDAGSHPAGAQDFWLAAGGSRFFSLGFSLVLYFQIGLLGI